MCQCNVLPHNTNPIRLYVMQTPSEILSINPTIVFYVLHPKVRPTLF
jgi:hypothetical protein